MMTMQEVFFISMCVEGFFYGLYSGIFVMYLQCFSNLKNSRTATLGSYAICLLYVLSTVSFVGDWAVLILTNGLVLRIRTLSLQPQIDSESQLMMIRLYIARTLVNGCCDFIAQCIMIHRCWIVWGKNIRVVIIPLFLAIAFLATWLAPLGAAISAQFVQDQNWIVYNELDWAFLLGLPSFATSLAVNALVTSLIVFKILKVFLEVKATTTTSIERSLGSTGGTKLRHIIFVIIESGMALFAIQLVRVVCNSPSLPMPSPPNIFDIVIVIHQMLNGITPTIIFVRVSMSLSFDDKESFKEAVGTSVLFNHPPSDQNTHQRMGALGSNMPPQERSEDICFDHPPSDPNTLRRMGRSSSSMPPQERSQDIVEVVRSSLDAFP